MGANTERASPKPATGILDPASSYRCECQIAEPEAERQSAGFGFRGRRHLLPRLLRNGD
jgi:hypothetical protein